MMCKTWLGLGSFLALSLTWGQGQAQIVPANDGTGTVVTSDGNRFEIRGGQSSIDRSNLFHSFQQFGLSQDQIATFYSNPTIQNILVRVVGGDASIVNGLIQITGGNSNLFLMNPAGIVFGQNARLDVPAAFTATTANGMSFDAGWFHASGPSNDAALVGNPTGFAFTMSQPGAIVNAGNLAVGRGQPLTLLGGTVVNTGQLSAPEGRITVAAVPGTNLVRLSQSGQLLSLVFQPMGSSQPEAWRSPIVSLPELLVGKGLEDATKLRVNPDGSIQLVGSGMTLPTTAGTSIVTNTLTGGEVNVVGNRVGLVNATVDASGAQGGGTVRIGGDYQGRGTLPNAEQTFVSRDSVITANAGQTGNGGRVIAWADGITRFYGQAEAKGGTQSGNGGFIEISGKENLAFDGKANVSAIASGNSEAPAGSAGTVLFDPRDITISRSGNFTDGSILFTEGGSTDFQIFDASLEEITGGIILQATNDININSFVAVTASNTVFEAGNNINVNADIRTFVNNLTLTADADNSGAGTLTISNATIAAANFTGSGKSDASGNGIVLNNARINAGVIDLRADRIRLNNAQLNATDSLLVQSSARDTSLTVNGILRGAGTSPITLRGSQITTGDIINPGRGITLNASDRITTGILDSSSISGGGNITLDPTGDTQVTYINAQGGFTSGGGNVDITTGRFFRATGSFIDQNGIDASISTAGGAGGGSITVRHGGGAIATPFIIGNAMTNGTAAAITSSFSNTISPTQTLSDSFTQGNIQLLTTIVPPPITPPPVTPPPVTQPPVTPPPVISPVTPPTVSPSNPQVSPTTINPTRNIIEPRQADPTPTPSLPAQIALAAATAETSLTTEFVNFLQIDKPRLKTLDDARDALRKIQAATGIKPALIYAIFVPAAVTDATPKQKSVEEANSTDQLQLILITAEGQTVLKTLPVTRAQVLPLARQFRDAVVSPTRRRGTNYLIGPDAKPAQQLYQLLIEPLQAELKQQKIQNLTFITDVGLRSIPFAALHDGQRYLIEDYSVGLMPTLSLADTRFVDVKNAKLLAMGASQFPKFENQSPLPAVGVELDTITKHWQHSKPAIKEAGFTQAALTDQRRQQGYGIVHLATHAEFNAGELSKSYIQFENKQLGLNEIRTLQLDNPPTELMVLSACRTAFGDRNAELGFAGTAVKAQVKSVLASLWSVSDLGSAALMTEFYTQLGTAPIKAEALRRAQLAMLRKEVAIKQTDKGKQLVWSGGAIALPETLADLDVRDLSQPYYWSAFTLIGNPW